MRAALGVYDAARHRGLRIGTDLSVISYDGIPETTLLDPPLSTYRVDTRAAGARLANLADTALPRGCARGFARIGPRGVSVARVTRGCAGCGVVHQPTAPRERENDTYFQADDRNGRWR